MILVVGDVMTDVIVRPAGPFARGTDCPAGIVERRGGSGANIACWIGHLGGVVSFAGRVGGDDAQAHAAALRAHGVTPALGVDPETASGRTVAIIEPDGERSFYTDRGANLRLCPADLPPGLLEGCRALHVSGHALFAPQPRAAVLPLMRMALARGCVVSVDAGSQAYLRDAGAACFADWTRGATLCFANAAEAALLSGARLDATLVVTDGARGAWVETGGVRTRVAAPAVEVVDSVGAGDAFVAGFLCARLRDATLQGCLQAGADAARQALAVSGGRPVSLWVSSSRQA